MGVGGRWERSLQDGDVNRMVGETRGWHSRGLRRRDGRRKVFGWVVNRAHAVHTTYTCTGTLTHEHPRPFSKTPLVSRRNPFYKNEKKTVEPHLLHTFPGDFYGQELRLIVSGYMRPEMNFPSLESLIEAIHRDIATAAAELEKGGDAPHREAKADAFLDPPVSAT
jgi:hypothetical protein